MPVLSIEVGNPNRKESQNHRDFNGGHDIVEVRDSLCRLQKEVIITTMTMRNVRPRPVLKPPVGDNADIPPGTRARRGLRREVKGGGISMQNSCRRTQYWDQPAATSNPQPNLRNQSSNNQAKTRRGRVQKCMRTGVSGIIAGDSE